MIKKLFWALALAAAAFSFAACDDDEGIKYANGNIVFDLSSLDDGVPAPESYKVTLTNLGTTIVTEYTATSTSLDLLEIVPGIYDILVSATTSLGGSSYTLVGTAEDVEILEDATGTFATITLTATKASALVIKEVHYNATKTLADSTGKTSTYLRDTYFEIYNNSEESVYLDGVCLGNVLSCQTYTFDHQQEYLSHDVSEYIWIETYVWQIPGDGTTYPLAPGESFIIAASAINHAELANSLDLTTAEFEASCEKYVNAGVVNNANSIDLTLACTIKSSSLANQFGVFVGDAWALFYPSEGLRADGEYLESNYSNNYGQEVLITDVLDAIDCIKSTQTSENKQLPTTVDAGCISCTSTGGYQSIYRKTASITEDGRYIYQDTNNTTDDFEVSDEPQIRRNGANRPSWATWTTVD